MTQTIKVECDAEEAQWIINGIQELNENYDQLFPATAGSMIVYDTKFSEDKTELEISAEDDQMIFYRVGLCHSQFLILHRNAGYEQTR